MSYDTHFDHAGGDYEDGFISPRPPCCVPWMGRAVSETRAALADGEHCREMAGRVRELARVARLAGLRRELLNLAKRYDRLGEHVDLPADRHGCAPYGRLLVF